MTRQLVHRLVFLAVLAASAACVEGAVVVGADDRALGLAAPPDGADACETFCAAATEVGCPPQGECLGICTDLHAEAPACGVELDALLACAAVWLDADTCRYQQPDDVLTCIDLMDDYDVCSRRDEDSVESALDAACDPPTTVGVPTRPCRIGSIAVDIGVHCQSRGICECRIDGETAHTCTNLLNESDFSGTRRGCCAAFFGSLVGW